MAHKWIARGYRFGIDASAETVKQVGNVLSERGYETIPFAHSAMGVPRGIKVCIAEPEDRVSRESALESLDGVFALIAKDKGLKYSVGRVVRVK